MKGLIQGVGINDVDYVVDTIINGNRARCPFHSKWSYMLQRCYSTKFQEKHPTYKGCSVSGEWLTFSNFREWMEGQDWEGKHLDKDLLHPGNKTYSKETCVFVDRSTNNLLNDRGAYRGDFLPGVFMNWNKYEAKCNNNGRRIYLGLHNTQEQAHSAYLNYKAMVIIDHAELLEDKRVVNSLIGIADRMSIEAEVISMDMTA